MRTLSAIPITATIEDVTLEERTQRLLVTFRPDFQREGFEPISPTYWHDLLHGLQEPKGALLGKGLQPGLGPLLVRR